MWEPETGPQWAVLTNRPDIVLQPDEQRSHAMFALIYDDFEPSIPGKKVLSVHHSRTAAENALEERQRQLGKRVWECHTRIVWLNRDAGVGDVVTSSVFDTWAPGEEIPAGDRVPDGD
jgi:hypothetical protein